MAQPAHLSAKSLKQAYKILFYRVQSDLTNYFITRKHRQFNIGRSPDLFPILSPSHPFKRHSGIMIKPLSFC